MQGVFAFNEVAFAGVNAGDLGRWTDDDDDDGDDDGNDIYIMVKCLSVCHKSHYFCIQRI